jgi:uncharacterized protein involved in outer membrane biogenesis
MSRFLKWLSFALLLIVLVLAAVALSLQRWVGSADFRGRIEREGSAALGLPLRLGGVAVDLWPLPAVALDRIEIRSQPALTLERVEARPVWAALLRGRLEVATLVVRNAVVPQQAVAAVATSMLQKKERAAPAGVGPQPENTSDPKLWPRRAVLDHVSWVDAAGLTTTVDAQLSLGADGLPDAAEVKVLRGRLQGAQATLQRRGEPWALNASVGGGKVAGTLTLRPAKSGGTALLQGNLDTANVEVASLTAPSRALTGRLDAHTTLRAQVRDLGSLAQALQTQTRFTVRDAVVHGIDLMKAVKTVGQNRGGETRLDALAGQVATRGRAVQLTHLVATSGLLSATGEVAMAADRSLSGRISVDLSGGAIGVPLQVGGTADAPSVTLTRGALLGAAVGTVILPGVGTSAGAKLGDRLGEGLRGLFGK